MTFTLTEIRRVRRSRIVRRLARTRQPPVFSTGQVTFGDQVRIMKAYYRVAFRNTPPTF